MKLKIYFTILLLSLISTSVFGQTNAKITEDKTYAKYLKLDNPTNLSDAITLFSKEYKLGKDYSYTPKPASEDISGMTHQRNQQFYKGLKIEFGMLITHSKNGEVVSVNGELYNAEGLDLTPSLTKVEGFDLAKASTNATQFLWDNKEDAAVMEYQKPEGELIIFPIVKTGEVKLAYKYDIYATEPILREEIYVDAQNGAILYRNPIIKHAHDLNSTKAIIENVDQFSTLVTGTAATRYSGSRAIETTLITASAKYALNDLSRGNGIYTYNSARTTGYPSTNFLDTDNNWTTAEFTTNRDNAALDAHWGAEMTYDFWKNIFNRNSFDGNNAQIKSYVHYRRVASTNLFNAFWNGSVMSYGDGSSNTSNPLTSIDVCGHEIGHAICTYTASLAYQNQSGGMNEGYSDIWGACIEQYGKTGALTGTLNANVWLIGEDFSTALRSMNNPNSKGNPSCVGGTYWTTTADEGTCTPTSGNDYCGVHNNSGVMNKWFYLLTVGENGTNNAPVPDTYTVTGIGMLKAAQIAYFAERDYLTANATYADARVATQTVASSLYCNNSPEFIAVTNAWYAVNVGDQYVAYPIDVNLKSVAKDVTVSCNKVLASSIVFENAGSNNISSVSISYNVDGGTATNTSWTGNLAACNNQVFPLTLGTLTTGTHILSVTTTTTSDGNSTNNTKTALLVVNGSSATNVINSFENTTDNLVSIDNSGNGNSIWERGTLGTKTNLFTSSKVYATKLSGNYPDKTKSFLVSKCYDLTNVASPTVEFDMGYDFEVDFDVLYVQSSTDNGVTWTTVGASTDANWYNSANVPNSTNCQNCVGAQWTGILAASTHYSHSLTPAANTMLRFVFESDDAANNDGAFIDNFVITGTLSTNSNLFEEFSIYPNPSNGSIKLNLSTLADVKINLYDMSGRNIYTNLFENNGTNFNQDINFGTLSKGIYLINVSSDGKNATKKLIIE
jgi:bacillolysin